MHWTQVRNASLPAILTWLGLGFGFFVAAIGTEIVEELRLGSRDAIWAATALKALFTALLVSVLVWQTLRRQGNNSATILAGMTIAGPVFFAMFEVDGTEAIVGKSVAMALLWATFLIPKQEHISPVVRYGAIPIALVGFLLSGGSDVFHAFMFVSAAAVFVVSFMPQQRTNPAWVLGGLATWTLLLGLFAGPTAFDQARVGHLWPFFVGLAGIVALLAFAIHGWMNANGPKPETDGPTVSS